MIISIALIVFLALILWFEWDKFTAHFTDREIQKFFDDNSEKNT